MRTLASAICILALLSSAQAEPAAMNSAGHALSSPATDFSAAKKRKRPPQVQTAPRYSHGPGTIACTRGGCVTVPPGCHAIMERTVDDSPSGFQIIIC